MEFEARRNPEVRPEIQPKYRAPVDERISRAMGRQAIGDTASHDRRAERVRQAMSSRAVGNTVQNPSRSPSERARNPQVRTPIHGSTEAPRARRRER